MATGTLEVHLKHARNLKDVEWILSGKQDPYVKLSCGGTTVQSKTHTDGGKNPEWNESITFNNVSPDMSLSLELYDENFLVRDAKIGTCVLDLKTIVRQEGMRFDGDLDVITKRNKARGKVFLAAKYIPALPSTGPVASQTKTALQGNGHSVIATPVPPKKEGTWILPNYADTDCWKDFTPGPLLGKGTFGTTYSDVNQFVVDNILSEWFCVTDMPNFTYKKQIPLLSIATSKKTGESVAVKVISKRKLKTAEEIADVQREVQIMHHLAGHKNVVCVKGVYEDKANVCIAMEVCTGGELFDAIVKRGHYTERDAANIIRIIVSVVAHCHNMGVIHRDLKPENFLLKDRSDISQLKATDFGLSSFFKEGEEFKDIVGSAYYVAPEVLRRCYSKEADLWSCGVILYILLCGWPPFTGDGERKIFEAVMNKPIDFNTPPWPSISEPAKDCVRRMLVRDPKKRATAQEILRHEWMRENGCASDAPLQLEVLTRIRKFSNMKAFQKEALKIIASKMPVDEINGIRNLFYEIDKDKSGTITVDEFAAALRRKGSILPEAEVARLMADADVNGDGTIDYEEFLAATMNQIKMEDDNRLYEAFRTFDLDGNGRISRDELVKGLGIGKTGCKTTLREVDDILAEVDTDGNGEIDFMEFRTMMQSL